MSTYVYLITAIQKKVSSKVDHTVFSTEWKSALTSGRSEPLFFLGGGILVPGGTDEK